MRTPTDPYPEVLGLVLDSLVKADRVTADQLIDSICFTPAPRRVEKWPSNTVIAGVYERDRYQCRYCGAKVILTPVLRLLGRLYPEQFPYHPNWKADATHPAFNARAVTLDHIKPIADGGDALDPANLATACWGCNRRKGDLRLEELHWQLVKPSDSTWMGLADRFYPLWETTGRLKLGEEESWWLRATRKYVVEQ